MSYQAEPKFEDVVWHYDPAASGPRRRAFVESESGEPAILVAYEDGEWGLDMPWRQYHYTAMGVTGSLPAAQLAVFRIWSAVKLIADPRTEHRRR